MARALTRGRLAVAVLSAASLALGAVGPAAAATSDPVLGDDATLFVNPKSTTVDASKKLKGDARDDARYLASFPTAHWLTSGTPREVAKDADKVVKAADKAGEVPVLVAYNLPFRDCAQYSAGGATTVEEYKAWIDGVAAGIGDRKAAVILEPDGLGIIPWYTNLDGQLEWCQPAEVDAETASAERFEMLGYAVDALEARPNTDVYLDGTHNGWLNVGEITDRLLKAGVQDARGFFLNASNYQWTPNLTEYGTWISSCIAYVTEVDPGGYGECGNQYWNGGPANGYTGVALDPQLQWSETAAEPTANTAGISSRYASILGDVEPTTHFVVDTSRNGTGPWAPEPGKYPEGVDPETWCNPPARGLGLEPGTQTGNELLDAYLWIKVPGESDGQCFRNVDVRNEAGEQIDPERGMVDPPAGQWFVEQADELVELAQLDG